LLGWDADTMKLIESMAYNPEEADDLVEYEMEVKESDEAKAVSNPVS